jgi:hypothetical protein
MDIGNWIDSEVRTAPDKERRRDNHLAQSMVGKRVTVEGHSGYWNVMDVFRLPGALHPFSWTPLGRKMLYSTNYLLLVKPSAYLVTSMGGVAELVSP